MARQREESAYSKKLLDPRWQKRRLQIQERDEWTCQACGETTKTLHVHHKLYVKGKEPWEYDDEDLEVLCEDCHQSEYEWRHTTEKMLLDVLRLAGFHCAEVDSLASTLYAWKGAHCPEVMASAIHYALKNPKTVLEAYFSMLAEKDRAKEG